MEPLQLHLDGGSCDCAPPVPAGPVQEPRPLTRQAVEGLNAIGAWKDELARIDRERGRCHYSTDVRRLLEDGERVVPFIVTIGALCRLLGVHCVDRMKQSTAEGLSRFLGHVLDAHRDGGRSYMQRHRDCLVVCGLPDRTLREYLPRLYESGALAVDAAFVERGPEHPNAHSRIASLHSPGLALLSAAAECADANRGREPLTFARLYGAELAKESLPGMGNATPSSGSARVDDTQSPSLAMTAAPVDKAESARTPTAIRPPPAASMCEGAESSSPALRPTVPSDGGLPGGGTVEASPQTAPAGPGERPVPRFVPVAGHTPRPGAAEAELEGLSIAEIRARFRRCVS